MVGGYNWLHLSIVIVFVLSLDWRGRTQDCWESCLGPENRPPGSEDEFREIIELINNLRYASGTGGGAGGTGDDNENGGGGGATNGTTLLYDTSVPDGITDEQKDTITQLQKRLTQIISFALPNTLSSNPVFLIKYDNERAWYCEDWACMGRCDAYETMEEEFDNPISQTPPGNVDLLDDSCAAAADALNIDGDSPNVGANSGCAQYTFNEMVIAVTNSPQQNPRNPGNPGDDGDGGDGGDGGGGGGGDGGGGGGGGDGGDDDAAPDVHDCDEVSSIEKDIISDLDGLGGFNEFLDGDGSGGPGGFGGFCDRKFGKKAIVGTGLANEDEMEDFASVGRGNWPGSTFVRDDPGLLSAADAIATCMYEQCCANNRNFRIEIKRFKRQQPGNNCVEFKDGTLNTFIGT